MVERLADIAVIIGVITPIIGVILRKHFAAKRQSNLDHVKNLELENKEIDEALKRMQRPSRQRETHE